jgi:hypothetical protein
MRLLAFPAVAAILILAGCSTESPNCFGNVATATAAQAVVTTTGHWSGGDPFLLLQVAGGSQKNSPIVHTDSTATYNLGQIALGQYGVLWGLSCNVGSGNDQVSMTGPGAITMQ